jgi:N-acetylneuraminic acid mutarotase
MFLFGGNNYNQTVVQSGEDITYQPMYSLNMRTFAWTLMKVRGDIVKPRDEHTAVVDEENSLMVIFGGFEDGERINSTVIYNMKTNVWQHIKLEEKQARPCPRSGHSAAYADGVMYVFGGKDCDSNKLNDLWSFNLKGNFWTPLLPTGGVVPCVRSGHSSCMYDGYLVIFGGIVEVTKELNDLFAYSI